MGKDIVLATPCQAWTDFLQKNEHLIYHTSQFYTFITRTFNQKPLYLAVQEKEKWTALFPAVLIHHPLFGKKIISQGYIEYGGFAGRKEDVPEILTYIKKHYSDVSFLEIRQGLEQFDTVLPKYCKTISVYKRFLLSLGKTEEVWMSIQKAKRKAIKKAEHDGVVVRELGMNDISALYQLYLRNMRSFGSPPYGEHFFRNFLSLGMGKIFGGFMGKVLVAALVGYCYQKMIHVIIAIADDNYLINRPNDAVHWAFIKYGCDNGYGVFDFGRTREGSGQHEYKEKFGAVMKPLHQYYLLLKAKHIPHLDPTDHKMRVASTLWKQLPLIVTEKTGHWLREGIGI